MATQQFPVSPWPAPSFAVHKPGLSHPLPLQAARFTRFAMSALLAPSTSNVRIIKSIETDLSPASILATRDWLDPNPSANAVCVNPHRSHSSRTPFANDSFSATNRVANRPARPL